MKKKIVFWVLAGFGLGLAACSSSRPSSVPSSEEMSFWQPHLLYLQENTCARLHVEVDVVEGCEPMLGRLEQLRAFLAQHCEKSGGISIARSDTISRKDAAGWSSVALARRYIDGPPGRQTAAFMYVLFYDGKLCAMTGAAGSSSAGEETRKPHVNLIPYPAAVMINTRYAASVDRHVGGALLLHEAGHLLGLCRRPEVTGFHCPNPNCLMRGNISVHLSRLLTGRDPVTQRALCADCEGETRAMVRYAPPRNLRFVGPVLVRSESGYHVLSLPGHVKVVFGRLTDLMCLDYAARVRETSRTIEENEAGIRVWLSADLPLSARDRRALERAESDPMGAIREAAKQLRLQINTR